MLSSKPACTARCTNESTRRAPTIYQTLPLTSLCTRASLELAIHRFALTFLRQSRSGKPGAPPPRKTVASGSAVVESSSGSTSPESPHAALLKQVDVIFTAQDGELWFWNKIVAGFEQNQTDVTVQLVKNKTEYTFWLVAVVDDEILIAHRISPSMNQRLAAKLSSFTWNHVGEEGEVNSWLVRFASSKEYENFVQSFTEALWQTLHQTPWAKIKVSMARRCYSSALLKYP